MKRHEEFRKKVKDWLFPLGFTEIFSSNHPTDINDEVHWIKDGIRVISILKNGINSEFCFLHADIIMTPYTLALKTGRYEIGTAELNNLMCWVIANEVKLKYNLVGKK